VKIGHKDVSQFSQPWKALFYASLGFFLVGIGFIVAYSIGIPDSTLEDLNGRYPWLIRVLVADAILTPIDLVVGVISHFKG
jgi:hypothetical protein